MTAKILKGPKFCSKKIINILIQFVNSINQNFLQCRLDHAVPNAKWAIFIRECNTICCLISGYNTRNIGRCHGDKCRKSFMVFRMDGKRGKMDAI